MTPSVSVILSTYRQPEALELTLLGYTLQQGPSFEVIVSDDGSGRATAEVVRRARSGGLTIRHVWHRDRGFRKTEALNRAILAAGGDYLIFSDGDCIPRQDFVETHVGLAEAKRFLSGGYLKLPPVTTHAVTPEAVRSGEVFRPDWLRRHGFRPGRRRPRLTPHRRLAAVFDTLTPTRATWNGHSASTWKEHLMAVNGFDLDMGWGGLDRAVGERLENAGILGKQVRHRAVCVHLHHGHPYRDSETIRKNRTIRKRIRDERQVRTPRGIAELDDASAGVLIDPAPDHVDSPVEGGAR